VILERYLSPRTSDSRCRSSRRPVVDDCLDVPISASPFSTRGDGAKRIQTCQLSSKTEVTHHALCPPLVSTEHTPEMFSSSTWPEGKVIATCLYASLVSTPSAQNTHFGDVYVHESTGHIITLGLLMKAR
jgi:hypothetical protein